MQLRADIELHGMAGVITEIIERVAHERPLVAACHIDYSENRASISDLNSGAGGNLRAAV